MPYKCWPLSRSLQYQTYDFLYKIKFHNNLPITVTEKEYFLIKHMPWFRLTLPWRFISPNLLCQSEYLVLIYIIFKRFESENLYWQKTIFVWNFDFLSAKLTLFKNTAILDYNYCSLFMIIPGNLFFLWKLKQFFKSPSLKDFRS